MSSKYDVIVVGAGHNGLTCACYLARAGLRVLALDRYPEVGGMTITHEVTLPGYLSDVHASGFLVAKLTPAPAELELEARGVELITPDPNWAHVFPDGAALTISRDPDRTIASIAAFSARDAQAWNRLYDRYQAEKQAIVRGMCSPAPSLAEQARGLTVRGLDAYRLQTQTARAAANELFESDEMRTVFASFAMHAAASPDDVGGGEFAWLFATAVQDVGCSLVKGGMHNISLALAGDLAAHGGEIRTSAPVQSLIVEGDRVVGVQLGGGEKILADEGIAASVDPLHLGVDLLGAGSLGDELVEKLRGYEFGDAFLGIYAALDGPPEYAAGDEVASACYLHVGADSIEHMSRAFGECRAGLLPSSPMLGVINESLVDPSRAPEGRHLIKLVAHFVPYEIRGDATGEITGTDWDDVKEAYADYLIAQAERYIPNLSERIVQRFVQSPVDYERRMPSAVRGTHQHGAFVPYQHGAFRPVPELANYRTPLRNLFLCGAGSHPGSGVSMAPGRNAAREITRDLGLEFPGVDLAAPSAG